MQICARCVMDESVPDITFDELGRCNLCAEYEIRLAKESTISSESLANMVKIVKRSRKSKDGYDCVMGVSGGVDSCYALKVAVENGLKPIAVHLDNGWNSNIAVQNIKAILDKLGVPLVTEVLDWSEFREIQISFIKSGIPNWEMPTDHFITATLYRTAQRFSVKYILTGGNLTSEAIMPKSWMYDSRDATLFKAICRANGLKKFQYIRVMTFFELAYMVFVKRIKYLPLLNYVEYDKEKAKQELMANYGWKDYGGKHYESVFTRFFQGYVLPTKYNIDKRKAYYSCAIMAGHLSRGAALQLLQPPPMDESQYNIDYPFILKKLGFSMDEFREIMSSPSSSHLDFRNEAFIWGYRSGRSGWLMERIRMFATRGGA